MKVKVKNVEIQHL